MKLTRLDWNLNMKQSRMIVMGSITIIYILTTICKRRCEVSTIWWEVNYYIKLDLTFSRGKHTKNPFDNNFITSHNTLNHHPIPTWYFTYLIFIWINMLCLPLLVTYCRESFRLMVSSLGCVDLNYFWPHYYHLSKCSLSFW